MIVYHASIATADDYVTRREPHRRAHLERLQSLRAAGIVVGGGPAPDGRSADVFYRLQRPEQLRNAIEEDPYWTAGAWTAYEPRSFSQFVEPWEPPPVVIDGSRRVTIVEGPTSDPDMAEFALIEMRGKGRLAFGGFFPGGTTLAVARTADAADAVAWLSEPGFWKHAELTARPLLYVL